MKSEASTLTIISILFLFSATSLAQTDSSSELENLRQLRVEDPAAYQQVVDRRKAVLHQGMQELKAADPTGFQAFHERLAQARRERLRPLMRRHPEAYRKWIGIRKERQAGKSG